MAECSIMTVYNKGTSFLQSCNNVGGGGDENRITTPPILTRKKVS